MYNNYEIGQDGTITSHYGNVPKVLKHRVGSSGYPAVMLYINTKPVQRTVHSLVMELHGEEMPEVGMEIGHLDDDKSNPHIDNLEWTTHKANLQKARHNCHQKLTDEQVVLIRLSAPNADMKKEIAAKFGVSLKYVYDIVARKARPNVNSLVQ